MPVLGLKNSVKGPRAHMCVSGSCPISCFSTVAYRLTSDATADRCGVPKVRSKENVSDQAFS